MTENQTTISAETQRTRRRPSPEFVLTVLLLAAYVAWMLWLPAWPSQDGPVHLYYTSIFGKLLGHTDPAVTKYFQIRHLLPPYALYYYALLGLSKFVPLFLADRLVICAYLISFVFGFRFLARKLGPAADTTTLLATLLLLNWPLGMGFVNYCVSLSFALWAVGLWLRFERGRLEQSNHLHRHDLWRRAAFVAIAFLAMLTHPVPLVVALALCAILLLADVAASRVGWMESRRSWGRDIVTLLLAALTVVYIKLFTVSHPLQAVLPETGSFAARVLHRALRFAREDGITLLFGSLPSVRIYRVALGLLLVACLVIVVRQIVRDLANRNWTAADTLGSLAVLMLLGLPFIPLDLNGLFYFADRLPLLIWTSLLLAASQSSMLSSGVRSRSNPGSSPSSWTLRQVAIVGFAVVANGALLMAATRIIAPISRSIAAVEQSPITVLHQVGFIMEDPRQPSDIPNGPSWNPYYWSAIHVVRHNDAVLANAPWMDETILPITASALLPEQRIPVLQTPVPIHLYAELMASPEQRRQTMDAVSFMVVEQNNRVVTSGNHPARDIEGSLTPQWACSAGVREWYRLCRRDSQPKPITE